MWPRPSLWVEGSGIAPLAMRDRTGLRALPADSSSAASPHSQRPEADDVLKLAWQSLHHNRLGAPQEDRILLRVSSGLVTNPNRAWDMGPHARPFMRRVSTLEDTLHHSTLLLHLLCLLPILASLGWRSP